MKGYDDWLTHEPDALDPGHWRTAEDRDEPSYAPICDACGRTINFGAMSLAGVGVACSHTCLSTLEAQYAKAMQGRRV